jgi:serine protease Do
MKKYFFFLAAAVALTSFSAKAQDDQDQVVKPKAKHKAKEIIIRQDNPDVQGKTIIVIEDGKVTINGKPSSDWSGGQVTVRRSGDENEIFMEDNPYGKMFSYKAPRAMKLNLLTDMGSGVRLGVYSSANEKGAEVTSVIDSSAAFKAGLKEGDIITKVDNSPISDPEALSKVIRDHKAGDVVAVHYLRGADEKEVKVTLEKNKEMEFKELLMQPGMNFKIDGFHGWNRPRLGANIQDMEDSSGVKVLHVNPESPAAKAGLQKDDVITAIDGKTVKGVDEAMDILGDQEDKYHYPLTISRGGSSMTLQVKIPRDLKSGTL